MPCAVSMPCPCRSHARHATPHQQKFEKERENRRKQGAGRAIHSFISSIRGSRARVSFLQREGVYDVTRASLAFFFFSQTLDPSVSSGLGPCVVFRRRRIRTETDQRSSFGIWRNLVMSFLHPFSHSGFTPRSAPHPNPVDTGVNLEKTPRHAVEREVRLCLMSDEE